MEPTSWHYQDILQLQSNQWCDLLKNKSIFDHKTLDMVFFVFRQPNQQSTASDIAKNFAVHYNQVTSWNRRCAKKIYDLFNKTPPLTDEGNQRFWNIIFDGNIECPYNEHKHFYWKLRPELTKALEKIILSSEMHFKQNIK